MTSSILWYTRVGEEILGFLKGRRTCIRFDGRDVCEVDGKSIEVKNTSDIMALVSRYKNLVSFLGSPDIVVGDKKLITPTWFIGLRSRNYWRLGLDIAWLIARFLEENGVEKSIYLVYTGDGFEVRIHEKTLIGIDNPVEAGLKLVEYVLRKLKLKLQRAVYASRGQVYVKNGVVGRHLLAPLSLISSTEAVVYFKLDDVEDFNPSWADTNSPRHNSRWNEYVENEVVEIVEKALKEVRDDKITIIEVKKPVAWRDIERFQVMGLLQAARYYLLKGDLEKAKSFGYNRAVFYAWAKHYGGKTRYYRQSVRTTSRGVVEEIGRGLEKKWRQKTVLGEPVTVSPRGWYGMGGEEHLPRHYDENIAKKIEVVLPYEIAWKAALEYLKKFPREVLENQQNFFKLVYQPVRDSFIEDVVINRSPRTIRLEGKGRVEKKHSLEITSHKPFKSLEEFIKKNSEQNR